MSFRQALYDRLKTDSTVYSYVHDRIFHLVIPANKALPAIVYQTINTETIGKREGNSNLDFVSIQIDIYDNSASKVEKILRAVFEALHNWEQDTVWGTVTPPEIDDKGSWFFEPGNEIPRAMMELTFPWNPIDKV